jgi:putative ABC transport system permease protein
METLLADLRHSFRALIKSPGFTSVAVLALALGIGANTAIFSVIDRVLLAPLPFPDSERIMRVERKFPGGSGSSVPSPSSWHGETAAPFKPWQPMILGASA